MKSTRSDTVNYFEKAIEFSNGSYEKGLSYLTSVIEKNPKDAWVHHDLAMYISFKTRDLLSDIFNNPFNFAERDGFINLIYSFFDGAVILNPTNPDFYMDRGAFLLGCALMINYGKYTHFPEKYMIEILKYLTPAISNFNQVMELNPNDVNAYGARALAFQLQGKFDEAILDYTKCIDSKSRDQESDANSYLHRGLTFFQMNKFAEAIFDFGQGLEKSTEVMHCFDLYHDGYETLEFILKNKDKSFLFLEIQKLPEESQIKLLSQWIDQKTQLGTLVKENIDDDNLIKEIETHLQKLIQIHIIKIQLILNASHFDSASILSALPLELTHCIVSKFSAATHTTAAMFTLFSNKNQSKTVEESLNIENGDMKACGLVIK
jgi:tetratricopeptide (TPR) repeat protein